MLKKNLLALLLIIFVFACDSKEEVIEIENGVSLELAEYRKEVLSIVNYKLEFRIPEDYNQKIQALEELTFSLSDNSNDLQLDFKESLDHLKGLVVNGVSQELVIENEHIILKKENLKKGFNRVEVNFFAGESSLNRKEDFLYTLFVPDRARTAFPVFDQPNLKATFELILDVPENWSAIANGPIFTATIKDKRKTYEFQKSDLISTYLFSFVAGEFDVISRNVSGREMTMLHRETDDEKVARNVDFIFYLHAASLQWLEQYTGIKYPFKKFDFALIPSFQYGGMEHVGAIQYRANSLFLDKDPSQSQLLGRASLIAHETAHMWFGNLVTMDWFNDVWTKEVFANFMAAKMVNPSFPEIDHELNFVVRHYPSAYGVDRTKGANPIRQFLPNLNEAGQMYGAIIYNKAPIMMRQLESLLGENKFQEGMKEYLSTFSNRNATWPDLISILDKKTTTDLKEWSEVWVNTAGRPNFDLTVEKENESVIAKLNQSDPDGDRVWPQALRMKLYNLEKPSVKESEVNSGEESFELKMDPDWNFFEALVNSNGMGYGLFPPAYQLVQSRWGELSELEKGTLMVNLYENLIEPENHGKEGQYSPTQYIELIKWMVVREKNQLILNLILGQLNSVYWNLLTEDQRTSISPDLERTLYHAMNDLTEDPAIKKTFFNAFRNITLSQVNLERLYSVWKEEPNAKIQGLRLSENDKTSLAGQLAIKMPDRASKIIEEQLSKISNPDRKKRFKFLMPALSSEVADRDAFFESLKDEKNRQTESWVLGGLGYLHHPLRQKESLKYVKPSLELLQEIQITGDIFFPSRWLGQTLGRYNKEEVTEIIEDFLADNPNYSKQLAMKIRQSGDMALRSSEVLKKLSLLQNQ
ncbi:M1 family metallopeptidase [Roseivirga sp.]|uniref:M1 family metallopeptidase n=1 Tax=Roseivirga sp. TaxID=1964215 RepID=UPI003B8CC8BB